MTQAIEKFPTRNHDPINVYPLMNYPNPVNTYQFDYAAPAGNENAMINNLKIGDIVYSNALGKIKKVKVSTANATLLSTFIGVVLGIQTPDLRQYYSEYDFTEDGGFVSVLTGKGIEIFGDRLFIQNEQAGNADTRDQFNYATHSASGAVLANLINVHGNIGSRAVYSLA